MLAAASVVLLLAPQRLAAPAARAGAETPFLTPHPLVVAVDRYVCSLLGGPKAGAEIVGQDGSHTTAVNGLIYWDFGDTLLEDGTMIPNTVAWSPDMDASDCISLVPRREGDRAAPLLPTVPGELTVWPLGMEATAADRVHFFYASVVPDAELSWRAQGVGIGSFEPETLAGRRALGGALPWPDGLPQPSRTFADEQYVYVFSLISREVWTTDTVLARVPKDAIESLAAYEYWDPDAGRWLGGLWDEASGAWSARLATIAPLWRQSSLHNGADVAYNDFLGRWLAVYTTGFMTSLNARTAEDITGPWDASETVLVRCPDFHRPPYEAFVCYTGAQHEVYTRDGGRTIYVTYSNGDVYQVYMHEIRLAAPVSQWSDGQGRAVYLPQGAPAPDGFQSDGIAFYASDIPGPGLWAIHRWQHPETGAVRYGASAPSAGYQDLGVDFYAPRDAAAAGATHALYAPVYRWTRDGEERYSPLDLSPAGYQQHEQAFFGACPDADTDDLTDCTESFLGTDPALGDTDGDGLSDGYERWTPFCDPLAFTDDGDGVWWFYEVLSGTNPCLADLAPGATPPPTPAAGPTPGSAASHFGDVDCSGVVNAVDGLLVAQLDAGVIATLACAYLGHVNSDGVLNALDALLVLQYDAGIIGHLPVWGFGGASG